MTENGGYTVLHVVICTYNRAELLRGALESLATQTAEHDGRWAVLVVDNNCTDHSLDVVESFLGRLPDLRMVPETRQGLTEARQRGFLATEAPWVGFVDDDCRPEPDWVTEALAFIDREPNAGAFNGHNTLEFADDEPRPWIDGEMFAAINPGPADDLTDRQRPEGLHGAGLVLRREAVVRSGWLDQPRAADRRGGSLVSGGDNELALRAGAGSEGGGLWFVPRCRLRHTIDADRLRLPYLIRLVFRLSEARPLISAMASASTTAHWRRQGLRSFGAGLVKAGLGRNARVHHPVSAPGSRTFAARLAVRARLVLLGWSKAIGYAVGFARLAPRSAALEQVLGLGVSVEADRSIDLRGVDTSTMADPAAT